MKTLYINYTDSISKPTQGKWSKHLKSDNHTKYHGGGNYTNMILQKLQKKNDTCEIILLWPKDHLPQTELEKSFYETGFFTIQHIESLSENVQLIENSTLFLPVLHNPSDYMSLRQLKSANPSVKIIATIHDLRSSFNDYGMITRYYFTGLKCHLFFLQKPVFWLLNTFIFNRKIRKGMKVLDTIFTDSNYSLQKLNKLQPKGKIIPHYLSLTSDNLLKQRENKGNYFLFVSGSRPVKNLLRTLEAFCLFKETDKNDYYLYVTGLNEDMLDRLLKYKKLDKEVISKWVKVLGYVEEDVLSGLYRNCSLLIYTSLYEGFGLPLLEAARQGRPAISSYSSSIPEVLGSCTHYVNPYDVHSISDGMTYMTQEDVLKQYEKQILKQYPILEQRGFQDIEVLIETLFTV